MSSIKYRPEIDGLRAVAVLAVLIYHFFPESMQGGLVGVDIFFVISGYLINKTLIAGRTFSLASIKEFYVRRILRIFPALLLMLWAVFLFGWIALSADEYKELGLHIASGAGFVSNFTYLNESGYFDRSSELKPLLHLWSLGVEEQFYLVWPLLLLPILKWRSPMVAVLALAALSFVSCVYVTYQDADVAYYLPVTRFWEILLGAALAASEQRDGRQVPDDRYSLLGLALILLSVFWVDGKADFPGWQALFPVVGAYLIIRNASGGYTHRLLACKWLVWIGLISYPLYTWHWPVLAYLRITEIEPGMLLKIAAIAVVTLLSFLTYRYVESPLRGGRAKHKAAVILLGVMVFTGLIGAYAYHRDGMDFREVNYVVYKTALTQKVTEAVGLGTASPVQAESRYLDRVRFDTIDPNYLANLKRLVERMRSQGNLAEIKRDFDVINKEGFRCDDARCKEHLNGPTIVVIGDSHAENFYHALATTHLQFNVVRFADSGCTPIAARYRDPENRCNRMLRNAAEYLRTHKVALLILAARWPLNFKDVAQDVAEYRTYVPQVAIAGPSIVFKNEVAQLLLRYDGSMELDQYLYRHMELDRFELNELMQQFARDNAIPYIDRIALLCGDGMCRLTLHGEELFIFDNGHLSNAGASYVGKRMLEGAVIERLVTPAES